MADNYQSPSPTTPNDSTSTVETTPTVPYELTLATPAQNCTHTHANGAPMDGGDAPTSDARQVEQHKEAKSKCTLPALVGDYNIEDESSAALQLADDRIRNVKHYRYLRDGKEQEFEKTREAGNMEDIEVEKEFLEGDEEEEAIDALVRFVIYKANTDLIFERMNTPTAMVDSSALSPTEPKDARYVEKDGLTVVSSKVLGKMADRAKTESNFSPVESQEVQGKDGKISVDDTLEDKGALLEDEEDELNALINSVIRQAESDVIAEMNEVSHGDYTFEEREVKGGFEEMDGTSDDKQLNLIERNEMGVDSEIDDVTGRSTAPNISSKEVEERQEDGIPSGGDLEDNNEVQSEVLMQNGIRESEKHEINTSLPHEGNQAMEAANRVEEIQKCKLERTEIHEQITDSVEIPEVKEENIQKEEVRNLEEGTSDENEEEENEVTTADEDELDSMIGFVINSARSSMVDSFAFDVFTFNRSFDGKENSAPDDRNSNEEAILDCDATIGMEEALSHFAADEDGISSAMSNDVGHIGKEDDADGDGDIDEDLGADGGNQVELKEKEKIEKHGREEQVEGFKVDSDDFLEDGQCPVPSKERRNEGKKARQIPKMDKLEFQEDGRKNAFKNVTRFEIIGESIPETGLTEDQAHTAPDIGDVRDGFAKYECSKLDEIEIFQEKTGNTVQYKNEMIGKSNGGNGNEESEVAGNTTLHERHNGGEDKSAKEEQNESVTSMHPERDPMTECQSSTSANTGGPSESDTDVSMSLVAKDLIDNIISILTCQPFPDEVELCSSPEKTRPVTDQSEEASETMRHKLLVDSPEKETSHSADDATTAVIGPQVPLTAVDIASDSDDGDDDVSDSERKPSGSSINESDWECLAIRQLSKTKNPVVKYGDAFHSWVPTYNTTHLGFKDVLKKYHEDAYKRVESKKVKIVKTPTKSPASDERKKVTHCSRNHTKNTVHKSQDTAKSTTVTAPQTPEPPADQAEVESGMALINDRLRKKIVDLEHQIKKLVLDLTFLGDRNWRLEAYIDCLIKTLEVLEVTDVVDLDQKTVSLSFCLYHCASIIGWGGGWGGGRGHLSPQKGHSG